MNKGRREEIAKLKMQKRIKNIFSGRIEDVTGLHFYKDSGKPCSCSLCRNQKYSRKKKHKVIVLEG